MKHRFYFLLRMLSGLLFAALCPTASAQHSHINAGARAPAAGSPLFFANGAGFEAASGFLIPLRATQSPTYGPIYYGGENVTFTSLAAFPDNGGPSSYAALAGTHIEVILETLDGPQGGALSFWDSYDGFFDATEISFTVPVGTRAGTAHFSLSENDGSPGMDPYGHIHGRRFSATIPGLYVAGFRLVDTARNGAGNSPLHAASELAYFNFQAGLSIASQEIFGDIARLRFGTDAGVSYFVEETGSIGPGAHWDPVAGPIPGTGRMVTIDDLPIAKSRAFLRLRAGL